MATNETSASVDVLAVMPGWRIQRNADGSIGVFAPEPKPGESRRTSAAIYPESRGDLSELMFKFFDALLKDEARAAVEELVEHANTASKVLHNIIEAYVPTKHRAAHIADVAAFRAALAKFA